MVFYPGKPAVTMANKASAGRRVEKGKSAEASEDPGETLQIAPQEQEESQKHQKANCS